jgi:hypothetical protein
VSKVEIDVPDMASVGACGACSSALVWMANLSNGRVFSVVVDETDRTRFQLHGCKSLQEPATWKHLPHRTTPSAEYLAAREALKSKSSTDEKEIGR